MACTCNRNFLIERLGYPKTGVAHARKCAMVVEVDEDIELMRQELNAVRRSAVLRGEVFE